MNSETVGFYMGAGHLNSGSHACKADTLQNRPLISRQQENVLLYINSLNRQRALFLTLDPMVLALHWTRYISNDSPHF